MPSKADKNNDDSIFSRRPPLDRLSIYLYAGGQHLNKFSKYTKENRTTVKLLRNEKNESLLQMALKKKIQPRETLFIFQLTDVIIFLFISFLHVLTFNYFYKREVKEAQEYRSDTLDSIIDQLIEIGTKLTNQETEFGYTALHLAVVHNSKYYVEKLVNAPHQKTHAANIQCKKGNTPLHLAIKHGRHEFAKILIPYTDLNLENNDGKIKKTDKGKTPYELAAAKANPTFLCDIIHYCCDKKSPKPKSRKYPSPTELLSLTLKHNNLKGLKLLLENYKVAYEIDNKGCTPFYHACVNKAYACMEYLYKYELHYIDPKTKSFALHRAVYYCAYEYFEKIMGEKINVYTVNEDNQTAINLAVCLISIVKESFYGKSANQAAINSGDFLSIAKEKFFCESDIKTLIKFITYLADTNKSNDIQDNCGYTALANAIQLNEKDAINILLDHSNLNIHIPAVGSLIHLAAKLGNTELMYSLSERMPNVKWQNHEGNTPLHLLAADKKNSYVFENFLTKINKSTAKQLLEMQNTDGNTVLHIAAKANNKLFFEYVFNFLTLDEALEILKKFNSRNKTAYDLASKEIKDLFKEKFPKFKFANLKPPAKIIAATPAPQPEKEIKPKVVPIKDGKKEVFPPQTKEEPPIIYKPTNKSTYAHLSPYFQVDTYDESAEEDDDQQTETPHHIVKTEHPQRIITITKKIPSDQSNTSNQAILDETPFADNRLPSDGKFHNKNKAYQEMLVNSAPNIETWQLDNGEAVSLIAINSNDWGIKKKFLDDHPELKPLIEFCRDKYKEKGDALEKYDGIHLNGSAATRHMLPEVGGIAKSDTDLLIVGIPVKTINEWVDERKYRYEWKTNGDKQNITVFFENKNFIPVDITFATSNEFTTNLSQRGLTIEGAFINILNPHLSNNDERIISTKQCLENYIDFIIKCMGDSDKFKNNIIQKIRALGYFFNMQRFSPTIDEKTKLAIKTTTPLNVPPYQLERRLEKFLLLTGPKAGFKLLNEYKLIEQTRPDLNSIQELFSRTPDFLTKAITKRGNNGQEIPSININIANTLNDLLLKLFPLKDKQQWMERERAKLNVYMEKLLNLHSENSPAENLKRLYTRFFICLHFTGLDVHSLIPTKKSCEKTYRANTAIFQSVKDTNSNPPLAESDSSFKMECP